MIETIRFRNDTVTRKRLMVAESFQHPAKGQLGMWATMVERYSQPGETVLDPMAGSGATLLAALMGRNVVCVELERHFVEPMRRSWEKMRTMPMLGFEMGSVVILQGDARDLGAVLGLEYPVVEQNPDLTVDAIISSPPYEGSITGDTSEATRRRIAEGKYHGLRPDVFTSPGNKAGHSYGDGYTRPVDVVITSPPYENSDMKSPVDTDGNHQVVRKAATKVLGYTRPPGADVVITSPPYEGIVGDHKEGPGAGANEAQYGRWAKGTANEHGAYALAGGDNIGNERGDAYWESMRQGYAECWRVLRPGGIMALVLKGFTRDGNYVDLPGQTEAMLLEAGWLKHDHWRRELWSLSFWRTLQKLRDPQAFDNRLMFEEVLAFKKAECP